MAPGIGQADDAAPVRVANVGFLHQASLQGTVEGRFKVIHHHVQVEPAAFCSR